MSGAFGYSQSKSDQSSESNTGISRAYKDPVSRDAYEASQYLGDESKKAYQNPFGYFQGQNIRDLIPQNQYGLPAETTQMLQALGNQWFSKASAGGAMRGQVTPENTNQIVGSSMLNASQFLIPHVLQNQQYLNQLPDQLNSQRLGYLQASQDSRARLLGSSGSAQGSAKGFGFNISGGMMGGGDAKAPGIAV